ncbi:MAG: response regulator [Pyrinomonadaceae bacterium]|nr:response regulator [Pyrinomonadaceae bacterium]
MTARTDKDREQLLAELQDLREQLAAIRRKEDARQASALSAEAFFTRLSEALRRGDGQPNEDGEQLASTVKVLQKLLENFPNGSINIFDKELRYLFSAGKGLEEAGLSSSQLVGKTIFDLFERTYAEHAAAYYQLAFEGRSVSFELPFSNHLYNINASPLEDRDGNIYAVLAVAEDMTEQKLVEERLRRMEERAREEYERLLERLTHLAESFGESRDLLPIFRALREFSVSSVPCIGIFVSLYDPERDVRTACYAWGDGEEFDVSELPPMPITSEGPNSRAVRTGQIIITDDYSKIKHGVKTVAIGNNDQVLPLSSMAAPMSVMGRIVGTIEVQSYERAAYKQEHVAAMRMAANLAAIAIENVRLFKHERVARSEAEESNRIKDEFLATLSHELRTPLTAVLGWTRLLREREMDETTSRRALDIIERNALAQKQLIEEILDVSRIITGKTRLELHPITLERVIVAAMESIGPTAHAKEIVLEFTREGESGLVSGDPERLQQVVWNLLSNAVKFTPKGGRVDVKLSRSNSQARIEVCDSGEGIPPGFLPFVFDRFRQADGSTTRPHGGLGLGLAIVRHLVELHGGSVKAESAGENQGSTFTVYLPTLSYASDGDKEAVGMKDTEADGVPGLEGLRVLIVDDEPDALEFLRFVLESSRAEVLAASSTDDALSELERFRPDVIISDIGMPGRDGYELVQELRSLPPERGGQLPAIALTAYARTEDETRALREGFQMHISKPFEPVQLLTAITVLCKVSSSKSQVPS